MWALAAALLGGLFWFLFRRWRKNQPGDPRLTMAYWQKSGLVLGAYLLSILAGAGVTRIMVGFSHSGWANLLMVAFFAVWVLYGAIWLLRFLPSNKARPTWLSRSRFWIDAVALLLLAALATAARMV